MSSLTPRRVAVLAALVLALGVLGVPTTTAAPGAAGVPATTPALAPPAPAGTTDRVAARAKRPKLKVRPAAPMRKERTTFSGKAQGASKAVLQRKTGSRWKTVARSAVRKNRFNVRTRVKKAGTYRVVAGRVTSRTRKVRLARQSSTLVSQAAPFVVGLNRTVLAQVAPVRVHRTVALQALVGGAWQTVASATTDATGTARLRLRGTTPGTTDYRVVAAKYKGAAAGPPSPAVPVRTARPTELASSGNSPAGDASYASVSADGRWVAFASNAQLLPGDNDAFYDIYLLDRVTGALSAILLNANAATLSPSLSADGRLVAFQSQATNLGAGGDASYDVFVLDRGTGAVELISTSHSGGDANGLSAAPTISGDGRFVTFTSTASNLTELGQPPDTLTRHGWFHNRTSGANRPVDRAGAWTADEISSVTISGDGTRIAFDSANDALDPGDVSSSTVFSWDVTEQGALTNRVNRTGPDIFATNQHLSHDGDTLSFDTGDDLAPGDNNGDLDVYVLTIAAGLITMASPIGGDRSRGHGVSADGRYVLLTTRNQLSGDGNGADDDVVVWDRFTGSRLLVSRGNAGSLDPAMSADGSVVAYASEATDLVPGSPGDTNVFVQVLR